MPAAREALLLAADGLAAADSAADGVGIAQARSLHGGRTHGSQRRAGATDARDNTPAWPAWRWPRARRGQAAKRQSCGSAVSVRRSKRSDDQKRAGARRTAWGARWRYRAAAPRWRTRANCGTRGRRRRPVGVTEAVTGRSVGAPQARANKAAQAIRGTAVAALPLLCGAARGRKARRVGGEPVRTPPEASTHQLAPALDERHNLEHLQQQALRQARPVRVRLRHPLPQTWWCRNRGVRSPNAARRRDQARRRGRQRRRGS